MLNFSYVSSTTKSEREEKERQVKAEKERKREEKRRRQQEKEEVVEFQLVEDLRLSTWAEKGAITEIQSSLYW